MYILYILQKERIMFFLISDTFNRPIDALLSCFSIILDADEIVYDHIYA